MFQEPVAEECDEHLLSGSYIDVEAGKYLF
jgi:hypothetical protein